MDLNQRPQRKKTLPLRFKDLSENITSKRSAKSQNMESDNKPEEKKIKIFEPKQMAKKAKVESKSDQKARNSKQEDCEMESDQKSIGIMDQPAPISREAPISSSTEAKRQIKPPQYLKEYELKELKGVKGEILY